MTPRIGLEQWRALVAVVDAGGYAQAAESLHKSQSTVTWAVQKIEAQLGVKIFEIKGRKAVLTDPGQVLYRRARQLVEDAALLEQGARSMAADWKPVLSLAVEIIFPTWLLLECLARFAEERPQTHIELYETVLDGTKEMLVQRRVDLAICSSLPGGIAGDFLMRMRFVAAAHPDHPLHRLGRPLTYADLRRHRHLVIRDTGTQRTRDVESIETELRWTVSNKATSIRAASMGVGFAWYSQDAIRAELEEGTLKALPMGEGGERFADLYLVLANRDYASRDERRLAEVIREGVARGCVGHAESTTAPSP
ncbi:MAG TPA: LysR family transcriptional regulator [Steroidobacteraceae bacterium]|nr:LysR family transcriptional regulator [Steroidobacteraceae bacterium]